VRRRPWAARAESLASELHIYIAPHTTLVTCCDARGLKKKRSKKKEKIRLRIVIKDLQWPVVAFSFALLLHMYPNA